MIARRIVLLACLFLAAAPLQSASGQEGGVAQAEEVDLDAVLDTLADAGVAEVSFSCFGCKCPMATARRESEQGEGVRRKHCLLS